jgi:hypothetical protein
MKTFIASTLIALSLFAGAASAAPRQTNSDAYPSWAQDLFTRAEH